MEVKSTCFWNVLSWLALPALPCVPAYHLICVSEAGLASLRSWYSVRSARPG